MKRRIDNNSSQRVGNLNGDSPIGYNFGTISVMADKDRHNIAHYYTLNDIKDLQNPQNIETEEL